MLNLIPSDASGFGESARVSTQAGIQTYSDIANPASISSRA